MSADISLSFWKSSWYFCAFGSFASAASFLSCDSCFLPLRIASCASASCFSCSAICALSALTRCRSISRCCSSDICGPSSSCRSSCCSRSRRAMSSRSRNAFERNGSTETAFSISRARSSKKARSLCRLGRTWTESSWCFCESFMKWSFMAGSTASIRSATSLCCRSSCPSTSRHWFSSAVRWEELVDAPAVLVVLVAQLLRLLEHLLDVAVGARAVEEQVVVGELALQAPHLVGQRLVLALQLAVGGVVLLALFDVALEHLNLLHDLGALGAEEREVVRVVLDLPLRPHARRLHPRQALLRHGAVGDVHVGVEADAAHVDGARAAGAQPHAGAGRLHAGHGAPHAGHRRLHARAAARIGPRPGAAAARHGTIHLSGCGEMRCGTTARFYAVSVCGGGAHHSPAGAPTGP